MRLRTVPVTFAQAREFISDWHRHHRPPVGHKYSVGRPVAPYTQKVLGFAISEAPMAANWSTGST